MKRLIVIAMALSITGCASISTKFDDDITADFVSFSAIAQKFGTAGDQQCAKTVLTILQKIDAINSEPTPSPSLFTDAYKGILLNRLIQISQVEGARDCGGFAAEVMIMVGKTANKFRP